ncbi:polysaccharide deacetylase family protein [Desulfosoma caldarium]|uniref:Polysaccharide deacetylase n=1 Tax=Desulfosoma caldarium TaxID=610254 RepID=A0A3N1UU72_9BACT|nr:polysaccharide deacetylase family protein [Desulfosoma caldarium]ROQ92097.1 polysaccharide deacetylase [Desulfosoma caldarium]
MSRGINILMYHQVGEFAPMKAHRSTYCDHRRFAGQMAYLARFGYTVLSMDQVLACLRGEAEIPPRAVALTFDDGYENFYEYAFPVLKRYGFPAMVYLISGFLGRRASWFAMDGRDTPPLMSAERLRQLHREGIDFGSHSVTHVRLANEKTQRIREEVTRSKHKLEDVLGVPIMHFCYPYGSHDRRVVEAVAEAGYQSATTCVRAPATIADDPLTLPRKAVSWGDSLIGLFWRLHVKNTPKEAPIRRPGHTFADQR